MKTGLGLFCASEVGVCCCCCSDVRLKYSSSTSLAVLQVGMDQRLQSDEKFEFMNWLFVHLTKSRLAPVTLIHSSPTFTVYL